MLFVPAWLKSAIQGIKLNKTRIDKQNSDPEQRKQLTQDRCIPEKQSKLWCVYYNPAKEKP